MSTQTHAVALKDAKKVRAAAHQLIAAGKAKLDPDTAAALKELNAEIAQSEKVVRHER